MVEAEHVKQQLAQVEDPIALLESLFAEAPVAFAVAHVDGRCLVVNHSFVRLFGSAPPPDYNLFQDEIVAAQGLLPYVERAFGGEPVVVPAFWYDASELAHVQAEGRRVSIEVSMTPLRDRAGAVQHVALWYKDVTAEHELDDERNVLHTLFEVAPEAIVIANAVTGKIDDANQRAVELFGYARDDLRGLGHAELSPPYQPDGRRSAEAIGAYVAIARTGEALEIEWRYRTRSGEPLPCQIRLAHVPTAGRVLCRVTVEDLRPRRLIEAEQARMRVLEEQNRAIHEANRLKSEFLAAMSHEVRTPLNVIIGFAELLFYRHVEIGSTEHHEFLGDILTSSRHLLQLINDVLDLAKVEAGKLAFRPEPVVLEDLIAEVTGLMRTLSLRKRIRVDIEADRALAVVTDPARFKQVLYNYLSNALKFTPEGGRVVVRTSPETPESFRVEVEDTGIGIASDQQPRLFVEFEQITSGTHRPQGTGLGLALTRKIVEAQGGSVGCRSEPGRGSVFHAVLPRRSRSNLAM